MSDLYLDLRRRIPVVTEWTDVGTEEMERAQSKTGLSDERLAREIAISAKTWTRWKKRGQIPTHLLQRVAPILGFELVPVTPTPLEFTDGRPEGTTVLVTTDLRESLGTIVELLQVIADNVVENAEKLERILQAMPAPAPTQRRAGRTR